jgi:hypothetical protein
MNEEIMQEILSADQQIDALKRILSWYEAYESKCAGDTPLEDRKIHFALSQVLEEHEKSKLDSVAPLLDEVVHIEKD